MFQPRIEHSAGFARATQVDGGQWVTHDKWRFVVRSPLFTSPGIHAWVFDTPRKSSSVAGKTFHRDHSALKGMNNDILDGRFPRHECLG